jgi:hypothetical protein
MRPECDLAMIIIYLFFIFLVDTKVRTSVNFRASQEKDTKVELMISEIRENILRS